MDISLRLFICPFKESAWTDIQTQPVCFLLGCIHHMSLLNMFILKENQNCHSQSNLKGHFVEYDSYRASSLGSSVVSGSVADWIVPGL